MFKFITAVMDSQDCSLIKKMCKMLITGIFLSARNMSHFYELVSYNKINRVSVRVSQLLQIHNEIDR